MARITFTDINGKVLVAGAIYGEPIEIVDSNDDGLVAERFNMSQFVLPDDATKNTPASTDFSFANSSGGNTLFTSQDTYYFRISRDENVGAWRPSTTSPANDVTYLFIGLDANNEIKYVSWMRKNYYQDENFPTFLAYRLSDEPIDKDWDYQDPRYWTDIINKNIIPEGTPTSIEFANTPYIATPNSVLNISIKLTIDTGESQIVEGETLVQYVMFGFFSIEIDKSDSDDIIFDSTNGTVIIGNVTSNSFTLTCKAINDGDIAFTTRTVVSLTTPSNHRIEPNNTYIKAGESVQFSMYAIYEDGEKDVTEIAKWGIGTNTIDDPVTELDGFVMSENGLLTANNPTVSSIIVSGKVGNSGQYTRVYVSGFSGNYAPGGTTGTGGGSTGGTGSFGKNETSDSIDIPSGSVAGDATSTGLLTRYLVNSSYLDAIGDWLWSTDLGLQIAKTVISAIYGNPAESVISLMSYPFNISTLSGVTSRNQNLVWGNHDSGIGAIALTSQAATVDWGTITLEEYWGNFLDYEPHTKIELYLPWGTGFVSIDPNMCLPGSIRVVTNIDFSKGSCIHNVIGNNNVVIGTYAGQCSQQIPIMSNDYASKMAGVVVSATALAVAGAAGGAATSAGIAAANSAYNLERSTSMPHSERVARQTSAMQTAEAPHRAIQKTAARLAASSSVAAFKRSGIISRNGSFTDGSAALGVQYPYIILSRPSQSVPEQYGSHYGYPSNIYTRLNNVRGYTEVGEIHLDGIAGTDAEIAELDSILKGGVIF